MKKTIFVILQLFACVAIVASQTTDAKAKALVDKTVATLKKSAYTSSFRIDITNSNEELQNHEEGTLRFWGNKLYMNIGGVETYFDGRTQWVYMEDLNEVSISEPTTEELHELSPMLIMQDYEKTHRVMFDAEESTTHWFISLYPLDHSKEYFRLQLYINKKTMLPEMMKLSQRNGTRYILILKDLKTITQPAESMFKFDIKKHAGVVCNELR